MGHSREEKAQSRERILSSASKQIREGGLDSLSVSDIMKSASLTHGGFYGHFTSREEMIVAGLERALEDGELSASVGTRGKGARTVKAVLNSYLSKSHRDNPGTGCAVASVAADAARAHAPVRKVMANRIDRYMDWMAEAFGDHEAADDFATSALCTMVGAIMLSRVYAGTSKSDQILAAARNSILALEEAMNSGC